MEIHESMSRRYTERAGAVDVEMEEEAVKRLETEPLPEAAGEEQKLQVSADGAMVPLLGGEWAEVKTVVIGVVQPAVEEQGEWVVHTRQPSYFSRLATAEAFQRLALAEMHRRGVDRARAVGAVQDGAEWEQGFIDYHCPNAVRILDFPHAGEHLNQVGQALYGEHTPQAQQWLSDRLHQLKQEGPAPILAELGQLAQQHPHTAEIEANRSYLEKRQGQLNYPQFRAQGWPIGSGIVESGNKLVVEARLKGSGMHWARAHVNPMLALRNILCSDRWKQEWPKMAARLHHPHAPSSASVTPVSVPLDRPAPPMPRQFQIPQTLDPKVKPPKKIPWRQFKMGRSLYHPEDYPKN
jgi:hypothetical protein